ncbi:unnamed protein product [Acanthoscelides obtectus]|uniref:Uncharacterized protein n=1 Tax=Acanthoscelides obtectus TaxID=200917 RepID=A0A9P0LDC7_ACAOB|nr:unnamed protein product [Acanthoscelides obtectus]CAK1630226.1 hypothetical protein AOBTE_LOCUS6215 [Acanthoscelides obtectus]
MEKHNIAARHEGKVLPTVINLGISELILTPLICASLVGEIFKGLLYQKNQIPYPYGWMESMVIKKRKKPEVDRSKRENMTVSNHYRTVSSAYDTIEEIVKAFKEEFLNNAEHIKEVVIIFGTMPQSPKEMFSISISDLAVGHIERNHIAYMNKYQQKILRNIFLSQDWMDSIDSSVSCTNTFVYLKKNSSGTISSNSDTFIPSRPLTFSQGLKHTKINIKSEYNLDSNCCDNLIIYGQSKASQTISSEATEVDSETLSETWYQFKDMVKGFRDCYVNKVSACELW